MESMDLEIILLDQDILYSATEHLAQSQSNKTIIVRLDQLKRCLQKVTRIYKKGDGWKFKNAKPLIEEKAEVDPFLFLQRGKQSLNLINSI